MSLEANIKPVVLKLFLRRQLYSFLAAPPLGYLISQLSGLNNDEALKTVIVVVPPVILLLSALGPYWVMHSAVSRAFTARRGEPEGAQLKRILEVPGIIEVGMLIFTVLGAGIYVGAPTIYYHKNPYAIPWVMVTVLLVMMLNYIIERISYQRVLLPYAIQEFHRTPKGVPAGSGFVWLRQRWYLPYAFAIFVASTLMLTLTVVGRQFYDVQQALDAAPEKSAALSHNLFNTVFANSALPLALLGTYLLISAAMAAWNLAQQQEQGARAVQSAMEALASGAPKLPEWVSSDEIGDLALATAKAFEKLRAFSLSLGESARSLHGSAEKLGLSANKQTEVLTLQATALQETQVTAQEIKQTSELASQKAESVLQQTDRANEISHAAELAIQRSMSGLKEVGDQVLEMANRIRALDERTRQIANITTTVKDLADQSNMLALNAAIEAVRSGEHGKGFGVVAREIRALADQSIQATRNVGEILQDIGDAIRSTVTITQKGTEKVETSLSQVRNFGESIQQLSTIVRDNAAAVRQITAAVGQQNTGISQIFQAVSDLSKMMDQTMVQLRSSDEALGLVRDVAGQVSGFVGSYGWKMNAEEQPRVEVKSPPLLRAE